MHKNRRFHLLALSASILIITGVAIMIWSGSEANDRNVLKLSLQTGESQSVEFENLHLIPGESCEYTVRLKKGDTSKYDLELDFVEGEEKTLKNFAYVKILSGNEILYDELLAEAFESEKIVIPVDFGKDKHTEFDIIYYLPIDVGNEAKNAEAIFELELTATNE